MNMDPLEEKKPSYRPEGLTDEEYARYLEFSNNVDQEKEEAELMELMAHPERWVSLKDILNELKEKSAGPDAPPGVPPNN